MAELKMPEINYVIVAGNFTKDPIFRQTTNSTPVVNFSIASNRKYKDSSKYSIHSQKSAVAGSLPSRYARRRSESVRHQAPDRIRGTNRKPLKVLVNAAATR